MKQERLNQDLFGGSGNEEFDCGRIKSAIPGHSCGAVE